MAELPDQPLTASPQPDMGFVTGWPVRAADVDPTDRLRLDGVARYLQDIAWENLQATFFVDTDPWWIVRRTIIDVIHPITWPATVRLRRWCSGLSTRWTNMRVQVTDEAGGLIETEGFWINVSKESGMPTRISDEGLAYLSQSTDQHRLRWRSWLTEPAPPPSAFDVHFPLRATDIDQFEHVNNAVYWQAVEHFIRDHPDLLTEGHRAVIEYHAPVTAGQDMVVRGRYDEATGLTLWFLVGDTVSTAARIGPLPTSAQPTSTLAS